MTDGSDVRRTLASALAAGLVATGLAALAFALGVPQWLAIGGGIAAGLVVGSAVERRLD
ncbi:hypothetical protein [Halorientalis marina]|jgi:hypothetical protein|uniref:hypothetical protein n=1 Tax=Halorientalis marina TaxID=2931976 RepID=UPI001FF154D4|nr:hypothetical protein [Halorientalis marina]